MSLLSFGYGLEVDPKEQSNFTLKHAREWTT